MIDTVVVNWNAEAKRHELELRGKLLGDAKTTKPATGAGLGSITMVAGGRNHLSLLIIAPDFSAWRYAS
ncbi:hypothetical protein [Maritalea sp.]|uniref:hypothetical protein n=1 Tax=Maritalea sp. TaxID=2003361 RepID=UPI003EF9C2F5